MKKLELIQTIKEEIQRMQKLAGIIKENKSSLNIEQYINDEDFMESFIANAEKSYEYFGYYENLFNKYEEEGLTEKQIGDILEYCDENDIMKVF
jgi:SOS response regulatory protein OraA/RecX